MPQKDMGVSNFNGLLQSERSQSLGYILSKLHDILEKSKTMKRVKRSAVARICGEREKDE